MFRLYGADELSTDLSVCEDAHFIMRVKDPLALINAKELPPVAPTVDHTGAGDQVRVGDHGVVSTAMDVHSDNSPSQVS